MDLRANAARYRELYKEEKRIKEEMDELKKILIELEVEEYFLEDKEKVVYQEGSAKSHLDSKLVYESVGLENFLKIASVSEASIKKAEGITEGEKITIIGQSKVLLEEKNSPTIKVGKMNKKELEEKLSN